MNLFYSHSRTNGLIFTFTHFILDWRVFKNDKHRIAVFVSASEVNPVSLSDTLLLSYLMTLTLGFAHNPVTTQLLSPFGLLNCCSTVLYRFLPLNTQPFNFPSSPPSSKQACEGPALDHLPNIFFSRSRIFLQEMEVQSRHTCELDGSN